MLPDFQIPAFHVVFINFEAGNFNRELTAHLLHRIRRIATEVQQDLADLAGVGKNQIVARRLLKFDLNEFGGVGVDQRQRIGHNLIERDRCFLIV